MLSTYAVWLCLETIISIRERKEESPSKEAAAADLVIARNARIGSDAYHYTTTLSPHSSSAAIGSCDAPRAKPPHRNARWRPSVNDQRDDRRDCGSEPSGFTGLAL